MRASPILLPTAQLDPQRVRSSVDALTALFGQSATHRQENVKTKRTTLQYGWDYTKLKAGKTEWVEPPPVLSTLFQGLRSTLLEKNPALRAPQDFGNAIVSDYGPGDHLQPHIDINRTRAEQKSLRGYFGECIIGAVLVADPAGHLFFERLSHRFHLEETDGMGFLLQGDIRNDWSHGVSPVRTRRLSVTYRTVEFF